MRVAVIGAGGREHALADALRRSPSVRDVMALPGSDGMAADGIRCLEGDPSDHPGVVARLREARADLAVIGPEEPLAAGLADALRAAGIPCFGPSARAAEIEASKAFAKRFMQRHGIPTAPGVVFDDPAEAERFVAAAGRPLVVKADGLAGGKGVVVAATPEEALAAVDALMRRGRFGAAGRRVVVEERLAGRELSAIALTDGEEVLLLPPARDHKALHDGDRGPNTGGMGAYCPVPDADPALLARVEREVLRPAVRGLAAEGRPFRGALYAGLMVVNGTPYVLEFNCRLGDPEAQAILPLLEGDLAALLAACAAGPGGGLGQVAPVQAKGAAVCVVLASPGYPERPATGLPIAGLEEAQAMAGVRVYHAGTRRAPQGWVTAGGRVVGVTGLGADLAEARGRAYAAAERIRFPGRQLRRDIAPRV